MTLAHPVLATARERQMAAARIRYKIFVSRAINSVFRIILNIFDNIKYQLVTSLFKSSTTNPKTEQGKQRKEQIEN